MKYILQDKYWDHRGWRNIVRYNKFESGVQACVKKLESHINKRNESFYKTRLVIEENGKFIRVYPPQKDKTGQVINYKAYKHE